MEAVGSRQSPLSCHLSRCLGTEAPSLHARYALPRYCEPLRLPSRPGLPLAGLRLSSSFLAEAGLPCSFGFPLHTCRHLYSGGLPRCSSRSLRPVSPDSGSSSRRMPAFPQTQRDRRPHYPFRSFLGVHSCYGLCAPCPEGPFPEVLERFRYLHHPSRRFRAERIVPGWVCFVSPTGDPWLFTAH